MNIDSGGPDGTGGDPTIIASDTRLCYARVMTVVNDTVYIGAQSLLSTPSAGGPLAVVSTLAPVAFTAGSAIAAQDQGDGSITLDAVPLAGGTPAIITSLSNMMSPAIAFGQSWLAVGGYVAWLYPSTGPTPPPDYGIYRAVLSGGPTSIVVDLSDADAASSSQFGASVSTGTDLYWIDNDAFVDDAGNEVGWLQKYSPSSNAVVTISQDAPLCTSLAANAQYLYCFAPTGLGICLRAPIGTAKFTEYYSYGTVPGNAQCSSGGTCITTGAPTGVDDAGVAYFVQTATTGGTDVESLVRVPTVDTYETVDSLPSNSFVPAMAFDTSHVYWVTTQDSTSTGVCVSATLHRAAR